MKSVTLFPFLREVYKCWLCKVSNHFSTFHMIKIFEIKNEYRLNLRQDIQFSYTLLKSVYQGTGRFFYLGPKVLLRSKLQMLVLYRKICLDYSLAKYYQRSFYFHFL